MESQASIDSYQSEIVLPKEFFALDVFTQLRNTAACLSSDGSQEMQSDEEMCSRESSQEHRRCRPTLERTLSHETTLKRKKREHVRMSLDEDLLNAEWATYSPEERQILDFVVRKASLEEKKSNQRKKTSKLQRLRIQRPRIFSRNRNAGGARIADNQHSADVFDEKRNTEGDCGDCKGSSKKPGLIRRLFESASHTRSPSSSPKFTGRKHLKDSQSRLSESMDDGRNSPSPFRRRPTGNFQLHTLLQEEAKRSSSLQCLSALTSVLSEANEQEQTDNPTMCEKIQRRASDAQTKRERTEKGKLMRDRNTRKGIHFEPEINDKFFEIFERFCKDPMSHIGATELAR